MGVFFYWCTNDNYGDNEMSGLLSSLNWAMDSKANVQLKIKGRDNPLDVKILKISWDDLEDIVTYTHQGSLTTISVKSIDELVISK